MGLLGNLFQSGYCSKEHIDSEIASKQRNIEGIKSQIASLREYGSRPSLDKNQKKSVKSQIDSLKLMMAAEKSRIADLREQKKHLK